MQMAPGANKNLMKSTSTHLSSMIAVSATIFSSSTSSGFAISSIIRCFFVTTSFSIRYMNMLEYLIHLCWYLYVAKYRTACIFADYTAMFS